jgi:hypothetical protein
VVWLKDRPSEPDNRSKRKAGLEKDPDCELFSCDEEGLAEDGTVRPGDKRSGGAGRSATAELAGPGIYWLTGSPLTTARKTNPNGRNNFIIKFPEPMIILAYWVPGFNQDRLGYLQINPRCLRSWSSSKERCQIYPPPIRGSTQAAFRVDRLYRQRDPPRPVKPSGAVRLYRS